MISIIKQIFLLLTKAERTKAYWCFSAMLLMAMVEVVGVASIMPFMAVISDPDAIQHHAKLAFIYNKLHFTSAHSFLIFLGLLVFGILIVGNSISMLTTWSILKFTYAREYSLSKRLFTEYLYQPYIFFLNRNASELTKNILSEVITVTNRAFIPGMQLIAKMIVTTLILLLLLAIDPVLAFVVSVVLGGTYFVLYSQVRKKLSDISKRCLEDNRNKYKIVTEAFGGIKDIKLLGNENYFIESFSHYAKQHSHDEATGNVIAQLPRYALETIAFGGVLLIIIYLLVMQKNINNAMPLLALYAFASFRLMPAMQQIFTSIAFLRLSKEALNILTRDLPRHTLEQPEKVTNTSIFPFQSEIELKDVGFAYPNTTSPVLKALNFKIPVNSTVGFVGMTGAGKTTLIDILLGLLPPNKGEMWVDNVKVDASNLSHWQKKIGYVPQAIFLADDTVANNIAFGIKEADIDMQAVEMAARIANIHQFIVSDLANGYHTKVGDRGIRLSGGQRQRIGIARALYHNPEILVLDEATSSLDTLTENAILDAILELSRKKTLIIISHRISTLSECDTIHVLKDGNIISSDSYQALLSTCQQFKGMAQVS